MSHLQRIWDLTGKFSPDDNVTWIWVGEALSVKSFSDQISQDEKELHIWSHTSVYLVWTMSITFQQFEYFFHWDDFPWRLVQPVQKQ